MQEETRRGVFTHYMRCKNAHEWAASASVEKDTYTMGMPILRVRLSEANSLFCIARGCGELGGIRLANRNNLEVYCEYNCSRCHKWVYSHMQHAPYLEFTLDRVSGMQRWTPLSPAPFLCSPCVGEMKRGEMADNEGLP